ncbi:hypothetical protein BDR03DRAFT_973202 [Suillus americanus]|nr:hypothetical protein BDR03DRAFT_973202 [Suillus americanus]
MCVCIRKKDGRALVWMIKGYYTTSALTSVLVPWPPLWVSYLPGEAVQVLLSLRHRRQSLYRIRPRALAAVATFFPCHRPLEPFMAIFPSTFSLLPFIFPSQSFLAAEADLCLCQIQLTSRTGLYLGDVNHSNLRVEAV